MKEVIIIGAGIAGCTAAIYASRKKMDFLLVSEKFGGQFFESGEILNYPGIKKTSGADFSQMFEEQLEFNNIKPKTGISIKKIEKEGSNFKLSSDNEVYKAQSVIIAAGSSPRKLNVPGEAEYKNKGLTYCSICDGPLFADKEVAVIGGGNSALEGVDFIKNIAKKIYLINIDDKFKAHEVLIEKAESLEKVEIIHSAKTTKIKGDDFLKAVEYEKGGKTQEIKVEGVIVEIGRIPNTGFVGDFLKKTDHDHIQIDCQTKTSVEGVFAAGDCASGDEYQYAIAAGQGCIALLKSARYLANKKEEE
jgi:thioredoxin-disulfide reductase